MLTALSLVETSPTETSLQIERYEFIYEPRTWQGARDFCADSPCDRNLLVTETDEEYLFIVDNFIKPDSLKTWLGLKYNLMTGKVGFH